MKPQPLLFLGDRRRSALLERVAASARRWRQAWAPEARETFEASCEPPEKGGFTAPVAAVATSAWQLSVAGEPVAVLLLPHATFAWCVHADGNVPPDGGMAATGHSLAESLEHEVARSLLTDICGVDRREVADVAQGAPDALAAWSREARAWKLALKSSAGRSFLLLVAAARIEVLVPARAVGGAQPLSSRLEAVGENTMTLRALVGETRIPVGELAGLALDDVLLLDQPLAEPIELVCGASAAPVAAGNLGRAGARRAIKITGHTARRN